MSSGSRFILSLSAFLPPEDLVTSAVFTLVGRQDIQNLMANGTPSTPYQPPFQHSYKTVTLLNAVSNLLSGPTELCNSGSKRQDRGRAYKIHGCMM